MNLSGKLVQRKVSELSGTYLYICGKRMYQKNYNRERQHTEDSLKLNGLSEFFVLVAQKKGSSVPDLPE
ncbi:hypothetical protein JCM15765_06320 [Paradesulfitobacterium aromaticivorans]